MNNRPRKKNAAWQGRKKRTGCGCGPKKPIKKIH